MIQKRPVTRTPIQRRPLLEPTAEAPPTGKGNNNAWQPTQEERDRVIAMSSAGIPVPVQANLLNIDEDTLRKHCPFELANGDHMATGKLCSRMFWVGSTQTGAAAVDAAKFWLTHKGGWRNVQQLEMSGPDGQPIAINAEVGALTDETRAIRVLQLLNKLRAGGTGSTPPDDK